MSNFITTVDPGPGDGPTLAVKDLIDVAGLPTTAGSRAVAVHAVAAAHDAPCMTGSRQGGARIVGKANLVELAFGASGVNEHFGTPVNPFDPALLPGGSSSGSAVAVATGVADIAFGSDTGGSIRVPAAFCGVAGLKTTHGRVPLEGVWPLAPSLDTVGPMARDVAGLQLGMSLLEPGFSVGAPATILGRLRLPGVEIDPIIDATLDAALACAELETIDITVEHWTAVARATTTIIEWEAARSNDALVADPTLRALLSPQIAARLEQGNQLAASALEQAEQVRASWKRELAGYLARVELLALPAVAFFPPPLEEAYRRIFTVLTTPANLAGVPALALPLATSGRLPASLQLIGPPGGEGCLLATGNRVEQAVR